MPSKNEVADQQKLLAMYRTLLMEYLTQEKMWKKNEVPEFLSTGISVIRGHILNIKGTLRGWKISVPDHPDDQGQDSDLVSKVKHQREMLRIYRTNLSVYLKQQEQFEKGQIPPYVVYSLNSTRQEIQRVKAILRGWNVDVEDLPEEDVL